MRPACIGLALLLSFPAAPLAAATDPELLRGIELVRAGEHARAVLVLEAAARRLDRQKDGRPQAAQAYLNLGLAHVGEGQETLARAAFREAASRDPALRLDPFEASPKVRELFQKARDELAQLAAATPSKKGGSKVPFLIGGLALAGGGAAVAASAAGGGGGDASGFTVGVCYETGLEANGPLVVAMLATFEACSPGPGFEASSLAYSWQFSDGATAAGSPVRHAWSAEGQASLTLTARDARGGTATNQQTYTVRSLSGTWDGVNPSSGAFALTLSQSVTSLSGSVPGGSLAGTVTPEREVSLSTDCGGSWSGRMETSTRMSGLGTLPCGEGRDPHSQSLGKR